MASLNSREYPERPTGARMSVLLGEKSIESCLIGNDGKVEHVSRMLLQASANATSATFI
jgi:hypothetical protein